jgi:hypothetical protein
VLHARESGWIEQFDHEAQTAITTHDVQVVAQHDPACEVFEDIVGPLIPRPAFPDKALALADLDYWDSV